MSVLNALYVSRCPAAAFVVVGLFWGCFAAFVPVIKAQLGASDALFGILLLGSATGLVSSMWLAPKADIILGGRAMQLGVIVLALAWLLPPLISTPIIFAASLALVGMASGLLDVVMNARVSELEAKHNRPLMNANHAMFSVAYAVAATITGFAREASIPPIYVFAGFGVAAILLVPFIYMDVEITEPEEGATGRYPLWPVLISGAIVLIAFMSEATVEAWSALHIERTLNGGARADARRTCDYRGGVHDSTWCGHRSPRASTDVGLRGLWHLWAGRVRDRAAWAGHRRADRPSTPAHRRD